MKKIILLFLAFVMHVAAFGQFSNGNLEFGGGVAQLAQKDKAYPYFQLGINMQMNKSIVGLHYFYAKEPSEWVFDLGNTPIFDYWPGREETEGLNFLYGRSLTSTGKLNVTASSGLSLIFNNKSPAIGIPLKADLKVQVFRYVAIGTSVFANINGDKTFHGANISFYFGNVLNNVE
jgi:hypothetical protein